MPLPELGAIFWESTPNSPDIYAEVHPDRVKKFPSSTKKLIIDPDTIENTSHDEFRHELNHDAESVFWLLLYWAMVVQPEGSFSKERIDAQSWGGLNGDHKSRQDFIQGRLSHITHSFYNPLRPLIKDLAAILVYDSHWIPGSDSRKDPFYITEAFQRLILNFIIGNRDKEFMNHPVEKTFRKVEGLQHSNALSSALVQSLDANARQSVTSVSCVCGSMNSCPFLLLCLQDTNDVVMDDDVMDDEQVDDDEMDGDEVDGDEMDDDEMDDVMSNE